MPIDLNASLKQHFGFDGFRTGQQQTVQQLLDGQSSLAIFPTGSGKSLCYQFTALHLPNLTLVVSPLLALMKDQLEFLKNKGIRAASIDSSLSPQESQQVMKDVREGNIKILMVSVERFKNERFRSFIGTVAISMLVVDEAHCISEWGHNFRPDYLKLPHYCQALNIPLVLLLTATATKKVKRDMAGKFNIQPNHIVQTGFYRPNLNLEIKAVKNTEKDQQLLNSISQQSGPGIVYVTLQHSAEMVAQFLTQNGVNAVAYHAGFDSEKRQSIQHHFMAGNTQVVVATIAFGMGIDKSDIRFVIHYDLPKSIENYSQEIGRAGRDGSPSNCITLANLDGLNTVENFVYGDTPELPGIQHILENIKEKSKGGQWELQLVGLSNASNVRQLPMKTLLVQLELLDVIKPLYAYFADFRYKFTVDKETILARFQGERHDFLASIFAHSQFKKIWGAPNFDSLYEHYQCKRDRVVAALEYLHEQQLVELETKGITEVFSVNEQALNKVELASDLFNYFLDKEQKEIKRIASLVRFFELDKCLSHMLSLYFDDQNSPTQCGHCSVCQGQVAALAYSQPQSFPNDETLTQNLQGLKQHLEKKIQQPLSIGSQCRFLAGISIPLFSRNKVRQIAGFGSCEKLRFEEILKKIKSLGIT